MIVEYFPKISETFILNQIAGLLDRGHEVFIYAEKEGEFSKVHPIVYQYNLLDRTYYKDLPADLTTYDIIVCQFCSLGTEYMHQQGGAAKFVTCLRGKNFGGELKQHLERYQELFKKGDLFMPVCDFFKQRLINAGCNPGKISVQHSSIDCSQFSTKERYPESNGTIRIVTTGRLVEKKGIEYALRAVAKVVKKHPTITYCIIGTGCLNFGSLEDYLKDLVKQLHIEDRVEFFGECISDEVVRILQSSHIFMLPSVTAADGDEEGIPNVLKEAMAMGLPVISTYHSGIPELIEDGVTGYLVPERDVDALADRLEHLINHPEWWPAMGLQGRKKIEQEFENENVNDRLEYLFFKLIRHKGRRYEA